MTPGFEADIAAIGNIPAVPSILDVVCRTTGMGFAAVARVTEGHWIACYVRDNIQFGLTAGGELNPQTTLCDDIRKSGQPIVIGDVSADPVYCGHAVPAMYGFRSYISVPIVLPDGSFFGTLCALDPRPRALDKPEIVASFTLFAELIACHLDLSRRVVQSEATLLHEREVSELREQFIAVLGHDLRNPLAAVAAGTRALVRAPERAGELSVHIERSIARMVGLIDNVLDFARGRLGGGLTIDRSAGHTLEPALAQVVEELRATHPGWTVQAQFKIDEPVQCDCQRMAQLLSNLLGNALTHGRPADPVQVSARTDAGWFELSVRNTGEPIPPAMAADIFQPFFRGKASDQQEGLGLGLYICSEIAKAHGATLEVTSGPDATQFTLRMPVRA